jgi:uncharacterized protein
MTTSVLWRRLDTPGHDACRLSPTDAGWRLEGAAVFRHALGPARIDYLVDCDASWQCETGRVVGWIGDQNWDIRVDRTSDGSWRLNDSAVPGLEFCLDLDLGFTPATNLLHLRRADLDIGEAADIPVAWLDLPEATLTLLPQRYERRDANSYWYESPTADYAALLEFDGSGFVRSYPQLWLME